MAMGEVMVVGAVMAIVAATAAATSVPLMAREKLRSATYELYSTMQVSRTEAVARNRPVRFVLDQEARTLESWDGKGTTTTADDELIRRVPLPTMVSLASPESKDAVTLDSPSTARYEAVFAASGRVTGSAGSIVFYGGGDYKKINLHAAGGADVEEWEDGKWVKPDGSVPEDFDTEWEEARKDYYDDWEEAEALKEQLLEDQLGETTNTDDVIVTDPIVTDPSDPLVKDDPLTTG
jgi:Tfp pilus assembly protein FimT